MTRAEEGPLNLYEQARRARAEEVARRIEHRLQARRFAQRRRRGRDWRERAAEAAANAPW